jgi:hypothetical protein
LLAAASTQPLGRGQSARRADIVTTPDVIAITVAIAAWIGLAIQRRAVRVSERDVELRVDRIGAVVDQLDTERKAREAALAEKAMADLYLQRRIALGEIHTAGDSNDLFITQQLLLYQQFALLYLAHREQVDAVAPDATRHCDELCLGIQRTIGASNALRKRVVLETRAQTASDTLSEMVVTWVKAIEGANAAGVELIHSLEKSGLLLTTDGASLLEKFVPLPDMIHSMDEAMERLSAKSVPPPSRVGGG